MQHIGTSTKPIERRRNQIGDSTGLLDAGTALMTSLDPPNSTPARVSAVNDVLGPDSRSSGVECAPVNDIRRHS